MRYALSGILMAVTATLSVADQPPRDKTRGLKRKRETSLVSMPPVVRLLLQAAVQDELGLTALQRTRIDKIAAQYQEWRQNPGGDAGSSPRERIAGLSKLRNAESRLLAELAGTLGTSQWKRLSQIELQLRGDGILSDAAVIRELGISPGQLERIAKIRVESRNDFDKLRAEFRGRDRGKDTKKFLKEAYLKLQGTQSEKMFDVLTSGQQSRLRRLLGKPFDVSSLRLKDKRRKRDKPPKPPKRPDV